MMTARPHIRLSAAGTALALTLMPVAALAAGGEGSAGLPQFDPTWFASQAFWLVVHFAVFYLIAARIILPGINKALAHRASKISADMAEATRLQSEASAARTAHEAALADARAKATSSRAEVAALMAETQRAAEEKMAKDMADKAKAAADRLAASRTEMERNIKSVAATAALEIVNKIAGVQADAGSADAVVQQLGSPTALKEVA